MDNPIRYEDPRGDNPLLAIGIGIAIGVGVDYGFQVAGNIRENGWGLDAFTHNIDRNSLIISGAAGGMAALGGVVIAAEFGASSTAVKTGLAVMQSVPIGVMESVAKQVNDNKKLTVEQTVSDVVISAVTTGYGSVAGELMEKEAGKKFGHAANAVLGTTMETVENASQNISNAVRQKPTEKPTHKVQLTKPSQAVKKPQPDYSKLKNYTDNIPQ